MKAERLTNGEPTAKIPPFTRASLSLAFVTFGTSILAASAPFVIPSKVQPPFLEFASFVGLHIMSLYFCVRATINLVRDVDRGYSPQRCALASVVLFFAWALALFGCYSSFQIFRVLVR